MALPTFNGFSLQDGNFITERIVFKGYADRAVVRAKINRREGIKLLNTEFGEKEVTISGVVIAESSTSLQALLDNMKKSLTAEEGSLLIETGREWTATVVSLAIPDEHYNHSKAPFEATFLCSNPFAEGDELTVTINVPSGTTTLSGMLYVSGSYYVRPVIIYDPPGTTGNTLIRKVSIYHVPTGQTVAVSGFGAGGSGGLGYQNTVTVNYDDFTSLEGSSDIDNTGVFSRWEPGENQFTITPSGRAFPGGSVTVSYRPRYL